MSWAGHLGTWVKHVLSEGLEVVFMWGQNKVLASVRLLGAFGLLNIQADNLAILHYSLRVSNALSDV